MWRTAVEPGPPPPGGAATTAGIDSVVSSDATRWVPQEEQNRASPAFS
jgi:hypothetical protein